MKDSRIKKASVRVIKAPLVYPFRTALGQHDNLENVLFNIELGDGTKGYGEAAVATHITQESLQQTLNSLKSIGKSLIGRSISEYLGISAYLHERFPDNKASIAAVEVGLMDALTRQLKIPLWKLFGDKPRKITTDITIVISGLTETEEAVKSFYSRGFRVFKVKIGRNQDLDFKRILAVKRLAKDAVIYLDANQGYSADQTLRFLRSLKRFGIIPALIEQPVPRDDFEGLKKVNRLAEVTVCADESASTLADVIKIIRQKAVGVINIKLMKFGLFHAREVYSLAKACGVKLMIGSMMESPLAAVAAAHLACGLGGFDYIDLDSPIFIKGNSIKNPYLDSRGTYDLRRVSSGIGIVPNDS